MTDETTNNKVAVISAGTAGDLKSISPLFLFFSRKKQEVTESILPCFKSRWWYRRDKLDARPVAWSLRNRPQDWEWQTTRLKLRHIPSKHVFWTGVGGCFLYDANCGCSHTRGRFQRFQSMFVMKPAVRAWQRLQIASRYQPEHFASHFIR